MPLKLRQPFPFHNSRCLQLQGYLSRRAGHVGLPWQINCRQNFAINSRPSMRHDPASQCPSTPLRRTFSTRPMSQDNNSATVLPHEQVETLWFGGLNLAPGAAPSVGALMKRWFAHDHKFDATCRYDSSFSRT
jgi:hypothetical protein